LSTAQEVVNLLDERDQQVIDSLPLGSGHHHVGIMASADGKARRFDQSGMVVSGPYRLAISVALSQLADRCEPNPPE
jgi:hypothetical protein